MDVFVIWYDKEIATIRSRSLYNLQQSQQQ